MLLDGYLMNIQKGQEEDLTLTVAAALVLESISITPLESLEGMHKCHDGLVAAGTALLEEDEKHRDANTDSITHNKNSNTQQGKSEILAALATILITTLPQPSGESILTLS